MQGAPGTGKTAVGLHRAAFLLYAHRDQLTRQGVLVVGPNASFLRYIGDVLPALGEIDAQQTTDRGARRTTLARLNANYAVRGADEPARRRAQGRRPAAAVVAPGAVVAGVRAPAEGLLVPRGARRWRLAPYEVEEIARRAARRAASGTAPPAGCSRSGWRTRILVKMEIAGDSPDDRVQDAVARSREVKRYVDQVWPAVDPARLVLRLLGRRGLPGRAPPTGCSRDEEQALLLWAKPSKAPGVGAVVARRRRARSTRRPTWSSAPRRWDTSSPTRRRTSRR